MSKNSLTGVLWIRFALPTLRLKEKIQFSVKGLVAAGEGPERPGSRSTEALLPLTGTS